MGVSRIEFPWIAHSVFDGMLEGIFQSRRLPQVTLSGLSDTRGRQLRNKLDVLIYEFLGGVQGRIHLHFPSYKEGASTSEVELPALLGILSAQCGLPSHHIFAAGEIGLDGTITLPAASQRMLTEVLLQNTQRWDKKIILTPLELGVSREIPIRHISKEVIARTIPEIFRLQPESIPAVESDYRSLEWLKSIDSEQHVLAALLTVGWHSALLVGPPGCGKSYFARGLATFLGDVQPLGRGVPPLVIPSSQATPEQLVFGYRSHGGSSCWDDSRFGILWLDEMHEFRHKTLEALRTPMDGALVREPHLVIGTTNPCPCGYWRSSKQICRCRPIEKSHYTQRVSGPLQDRICIGYSPATPIRSKLILPEGKELIEFVKEFNHDTVAQWAPMKDILQALRKRFGEPPALPPALDLSKRRESQLLRLMLTVSRLAPQFSWNDCLEEAWKWDAQQCFHSWWSSGPVHSVGPNSAIVSFPSAGSAPASFAASPDGINSLPKSVAETLKQPASTPTQTSPSEDTFSAPN
jgi:magnesium chelatase family protein